MSQLGQPIKVRATFVASGTALKVGVINFPPTWIQAPTVVFNQGVTATFPVSGTYQSNGYVTDPEGDSISITKNNVFVQGVTWDGFKFTTNGTGSASTIAGHILTANDGHGNSVPSQSFIIQINPVASWTGVPSPIYISGQALSYSVSSFVAGYNPSTDVITVDPSGAQIGPGSSHTWLTLPGNGANLVASGSQVDADDFSNLRLRVIRNGVLPGALSGAITVIVSPISLWSSTPAPIYVAGQALQFQVTGSINNYNNATDVVTVDPSGTQIGPGSAHTWLTISTPLGTFLTASGTQVETDDFLGLRLRVTRSGVGFEVSGPITVVVNPSSVVSTHTWVKRSIGNTGGNFSQSSYGSCVDRNNGKIFMYWHDAKYWDPSTGQWTILNAIMGTRENAIWAHDTVNNVYWCTNTLQRDQAFYGGTIFYDPVTNTFTAVIPENQSFMPGNAAMGWDPATKRLLGFGGFGQPAGDVKLRRLDVTTRARPAGDWINLSPTGPQPAMVSPESGYSYTRGGVDTRDGSCWVIDDTETYLKWTPSTNAWAIIPTTGTKPNHFSIFALDETRNCIIAHCGAASVNIDRFPAVDETRILDLATNVWTLVANGAANTPQERSNVASCLMNYDKLNGRVLYNAFNPSTASQDVWELLFPSSGSGLNIPNRVFVAKAMSANMGMGAWINPTDTIGKQNIWLNDKLRGRVVTCGGDNHHQGWAISDSHDRAATCEVWSYNPVQADTGNFGWTMVSPFSLGPGRITPGRPNDGNPWVHDTRRDRYWLCPGGWGTGNQGSENSGDHGTVCTISGQNGLTINSVAGATYFVGLMWCHPDTGVWTGITNAAINSPCNPSWGGTLTGCLHPGIYDPVQDCIYCLEGSSGFAVYRIFLNDNPALMTSSRVTVPTPGIAPDYAARVSLQQPCFDLVTRQCYLLTLRGDASSGFNSGYVFMSFNMDNPGAGATILATPPHQSPLLDPGGTGGACQIYFDTKNRVVIWPKRNSPEGDVQNMCVYQPTSNTWDPDYPVTFATGGLQQPSPPLDPFPTGNQGVYDETHNCVILGGATDNPYFARGFIYLWRYA